MLWFESDVPYSQTFEYLNPTWLCRLVRLRWMWLTGESTSLQGGHGVWDCWHSQFALYFLLGVGDGSSKLFCRDFFHSNVLSLWRCEPKYTLPSVSRLAHGILSINRKELKQEYNPEEDVKSISPSPFFFSSWPPLSEQISFTSHFWSQYTMSTETQSKGPTDHGLKPLKSWAKIIISCFSQAFYPCLKMERELISVMKARNCLYSV